MQPRNDRTFKKIHLISDYIEERQAEIDQYNKDHQVDGTIMPNGRKLTNIGVFAVYLENYLKANPNINQDMTIMVRQLSSTPEGLPIEIYAFSIHKEWTIYEKIMSDLFDHILASVAYFDLQIFESPSGNDFQKLSQ